MKSGRGFGVIVIVSALLQAMGVYTKVYADVVIEFAPRS